MKNINKKLLTAFFVGYFTSIITLFYIGWAFNNKGRPSNIPYEYFAVLIPISYGFFGIINYYAVKYGNNTNWSLLVGAIFGFLLSIIGRFTLKLPSKLFNVGTKSEYMVHIYAIILYSIIFRFILTPIMKYIM